MWRKYKYWKKIGQQVKYYGAKKKLNLIVGCHIHVMAFVVARFVFFPYKFLLFPSRSIFVSPSSTCLRGCVYFFIMLDTSLSNTKMRLGKLVKRRSNRSRRKWKKTIYPKRVIQDSSALTYICEVYSPIKI